MRLNNADGSISTIILDALVLELQNKHSYSVYNGEINVLRGCDGMYIRITEWNEFDQIAVYFQSGGVSTVHIGCDLQEVTSNVMRLVEESR